MTLCMAKPRRFDAIQTVSGPSGGQKRGLTTMAKVETAPDEVEVTKRVTILGYLDDQDTTLRNWAQAFDDDRDYFERRNNKKEKRFLEFGPIKKRVYDDDEWSELKNMDLGDGKLTTEVEVDNDFKWSPSKAARILVRSIMSGLDVDLPEGLNVNLRYGHINDEDGDRILRRRVRAEKNPLLKHQSEVEPGDPWVDSERNYNTIKVQLTLGAVSPERLEWLEEQITQPFMAAFGKHDQISRVRLAECENQTTEKGQCFNL